MLVQAVDLEDMHAAVSRLLAFYILLLVCLGGVKVFVILCESERVYACARKILVSVSSLSLPVTFSPLSEIRNSMDSS